MNYSLNHTRNQQIGNIGETWVYDQLTERGYDVLAVENYFAQCADLKIGTLPIEVKYAKKTRRRKRLKNNKVKWYPRWQWNVVSVNTADRVLFLLAEDTNRQVWPFIMPGSVMADSTIFEINTHPQKYTGRISGFLNCWETVDFLLKQSYYDDRQLTIYHYLTSPESAA